MAEFQVQYTKEESKDTPSAEYPQLDNNPALQSPQPYPPQQYQPPPSYSEQQYPTAEPQPAVQVVVQQQPQKIVASRYSGGAPQSYIVFSITCLVLTALCAWPLLLCTIPALIFSILSKDKANRGELETATVYGRWAFGLNAFAVIGFFVLIIVIIVIEVSD